MAAIQTVVVTEEQARAHLQRAGAQLVKRDLATRVFTTREGKWVKAEILGNGYIKLTLASGKCDC